MPNNRNQESKNKPKREQAGQQGSTPTNRSNPSGGSQEGRASGRASNR